MSEKANFSNIYNFYDLINTVLTLGFDKSWREKAADNLVGTSVLDLGSGTGAAFDQLLNYETTAIDPDKKMLELNRFENKVLGSAENLPLRTIVLTMFFVVSYGEMYQILIKLFKRYIES